MKKAIMLTAILTAFTVLFLDVGGAVNSAGTYDYAPEIKEMIIPSDSPNRPGDICDKTYITIHETGNYAEGANAEMHAGWLYNGSDGEIGYQYTVDDAEIYQSLPDNEKSWHAGDGEEGTGNLYSIGIELCVNEGSDIEKTRRNAAFLTARLMNEYNIPIENVVQHNYWSGKDCPSLIRAEDGAWESFLEMCRIELEVRKNGGVSGVSIFSLPDKLEYNKGEELSCAGGKITVKYANGLEGRFDMNQLMTGSFDSENLGEQVIKLNVLTLSSEYIVNVSPKCPDSIVSALYATNNSNGYISKIGIFTSLDSFKANIEDSGYISVYDGDTKLSGKDIIGTGMRVVLSDGSLVKAEYIAAVTGDVDGDGKITEKDAKCVLDAIMGRITLSGIKKAVCDTNNDSLISITDYVQISAAAKNKFTIAARQY